METFLNRTLDRFPRPGLRLLNQPLPAFQVCGYTGLLLGFVQSMVLIRRLGLSQLVLLGITGVVILTFFALVMATKILTGEEQIIYYHHEIGVVAMAALFLRLAHQPVLAYVDVTILGIGLFLACGRIGCLMVGCCHGRPWNWGVIYGKEHAEAGFPSYLVGVRLFPIQAAESVYVLGIVAFGSILMLKGHPPGTALAFYVIAYGFGRFWIEFARADTERPYFWGFSEAQWISLLLMIAVVWAERAKILPASSHLAAAVGLAASMVLISLWRRFAETRRFEFLHPHHVREIANALHVLSLLSHPLNFDFRLNSRAAEIHVARTSLGIRISAGETMEGAHPIRHYSLSKDNGSLSFGTARILARQIACLEHDSSPFGLRHGSVGVFHLLFTLPINLS